MAYKPRIDWDAKHREANQGPAYLTHSAVMMRLKETENDQKARAVLGTQRIAQLPSIGARGHGYGADMKSMRSGATTDTSSVTQKQI